MLAPTFAVDRLTARDLNTAGTMVLVADVAPGAAGSVEVRLASMAYLRLDGSVQGLAFAQPPGEVSLANSAHIMAAGRLGLGMQPLPRLRGQVGVGAANALFVSSETTYLAALHQALQLVAHLQVGVVPWQSTDWRMGLTGRAELAQGPRWARRGILVGLQASMHRRMGEAFAGWGSLGWWGRRQDTQFVAHREQQLLLQVGLSWSSPPRR